MFVCCHHQSHLLIDGDLSLDRILFDPVTESISGMIDFGTSGLGDPACDIAVQLGNRE
ncbi:phosphotransferase [Plectonema radiosum NIES-515]|uniref:Phosphotransferase n=1 Tax=Plectonema radiosum NIES-515 TaxID=2986073 RepID=A0ABT3B4M8_9CYAN|nr:phosphotransferase [Plectonema radiosum]MCV3216326.1 phosphotransferase [Plectonema radiosum NIES-515]